MTSSNNSSMSDTASTQIRCHDVDKQVLLLFTPKQAIYWPVFRHSQKLYLTPSQSARVPGSVQQKASWRQQICSISSRSKHS